VENLCQESGLIIILNKNAIAKTTIYHLYISKKI